MSTVEWKPWKIATIGLAVVVTTMAVTTLVVGSWNDKEVKKPAPAVFKAKPRQVAASPSTPGPARAQVRQAAGGPAATDIESCNTYARSVTSDKTTEVVKDAVIGGATAGTLYGLNETNKQDARAVEAYRSCMRERGYSS